MNIDFDKWRAAQPEPAMRMVWWRECKWLIASHLLVWGMKLVGSEMTGDTARHFMVLWAALRPDPRFDTVPMRPARRKNERPAPLPRIP